MASGCSASDQQVHSKVILESLLQLKRQGSQRVMEDIEKLEPDLANYLIENLSLLHQRLLELGARPKQTSRVYQQIQSVALVCILSLRNSHYQLWRQSIEGSALAELDPTLPDEPAPPDRD